MVTRTEQRMAGAAAGVTAVCLAGGLLLFGNGPASSTDSVVLTYFHQYAPLIRLSALLLLAATISLVVFAVAVREAIWALVLDRNWASMVFVQGAVGFAAVSAVAAALLWSLADQAASGALSADLAGTLWAVDRTLWRFATWGLIVPLVVVGLVLHRYSRLGRFGAVVGVVVALGLLVPGTWTGSLYAFAAWLVVAGVTFARPVGTSQEVPHPELVE